MKILLTGGSKSGKSDLAQDLAIYLSPEGRRYYVATMIPADDEDRERIRKHLANRDGLGFETLECGRHIETATAGGGTCLLDSVTALMANEMFEGTLYHEDAARRMLPGLRNFLTGWDHAVLVFDSLYSDAAVYDTMTENYRRSLAYLLRETASVCDTVIDMKAGLPDVIKGGLPEGFEAWMAVTDKKTAGTAYNRSRSAEGKPVREVVFGGAGQGQEAYVREKYGFSEADIGVCTAGALPDLTKPCLLDVEQAVLFCLKHDRPVEPLWENGAVLVFTDMSRGIVPIDPLMRRWREEASRLMREAAGLAEIVTEVTAGLPRQLKG